MTSRLGLELELLSLLNRLEFQLQSGAETLVTRPRETSLRTGEVERSTPRVCAHVAQSSTHMGPAPRFADVRTSLVTRLRVATAMPTAPSPCVKHPASSRLETSLGVFA